MSNKLIIVFCFVAATLCSCKSPQNSPTTEPPASTEQTTQNALETTKCGDTVCKDGEICKDNHCETVAPVIQPTSSDSQPAIVQIADEDHVQCGETVCQFDEVCKDNQCKTRFEMNIYLAPIPKAGIVKNDSYDYWECQSETCTYQADKTYTIPKGMRVRETEIYCGGENISLSEMKDYICTNKGWVCSSPDGCACEGDCRYNSCSVEKCSPGEKCDNHSCKYADAAINNFFLCKDGNCACGTQQCGKNQICAYDNCYFAGNKRNGFADCEFSEYSDTCGTSDTPIQLIRYLCPTRCPSEIPPKKQDDYKIETFNLGDCYEIALNLWTCQNEDGCECGDLHCPKDASCIDGQCVLYTAYEGYESPSIADESTSYVDHLANTHLFASTCAIEYPDVLSYQPKVTAHYQVTKTQDYPYNRFWMCDESNECICNGERLPPGMLCHREKDGTEYIAALDSNGSKQRAPKKIKNYIFKDDRWICQNDACLCGNKPLPTNANCKDDIIYCYYDHEMPSDVTGYTCSEKDKKWVCASDKCLCGGVELRHGADCVHRNGNDYQCCHNAYNYSCFTPQTASEYDCIDKKWVVKAEEGQRHCQNKPLPAGAICESNDDKKLHQEYAKCGSEIRLEWEDYQCENDHWECALKDKPCACNGKPLPDGAKCKDNEASCGNENLQEWDDYQCENGQWKCALKDKPCVCDGKPLPEGTRCYEDKAYCGSNSKDNWDGFSCQNGEWIDHSPKSKLCFGHKLNDGVICPSYNDIHFVDDITMSDMESCEHVRGCLCHEKLCSPSGICTEHGCIDPLTDKPFEAKDGYLVSDKLRQCAQPNGCKCGETKIEYRDYCYNNVQYISMKSCVSDKKRMIGENNYTSYECDYGDASWINECSPDSKIDLSQYFVRDCLTANQAFFSDRSVDHYTMNVCMQKEGCQCIHNTCKYNEACYKGQCVADYPCHYLEPYGEEDDKIGKCRPSRPEE